MRFEISVEVVHNLSKEHQVAIAVIFISTSWEAHS